MYEWSVLVGHKAAVKSVTSALLKKPLVREKKTTPPVVESFVLV